MVISVFPNYGSGFQAFERARGNRLQAEAARTEMDLRERQRQAYNRMLQGVPQDQRPMYEVLGPEQGTAMMLQGQQAAAQAEAERAAELQERARAFQTEVVFPAVQEAAPAFLGMEGNERSQFVNNLTRRLNIQAQAYGGRGQANPEAIEQMLLGYAPEPRDVNFRPQTFEDSQGNIYEALTDPLDPQAPPQYRAITPGAPERPVGRLQRLRARTVDETPTPSPVSTGDEDFDPEVYFFGNSLSNAFQVGMQADLNDFGTPGRLRRLAQDIGQQVLGMRGVTFGGLRDIALAEASPDANRERIEQFFDLSGYDGDNRQIERDFRLLAYQAASALAQQTGRGLSDRDLQQFRDILGNPTSFLGNKPAYLQALQDLDQRIISRINAHRQAQNLPLIPEGVSFIDGSFQQYASNPTTYRSAPPPPPRSGGPSEILSRGDFETDAEYDAYLDEVYGG